MATNRLPLIVRHGFNTRLFQKLQAIPNHQTGKLFLTKVFNITILKFDDILSSNMGTSLLTHVCIYGGTKLPGCYSLMSL